MSKSAKGEDTHDVIDLTTSPPIPAPKKRKCLEEMSCSPLQWAGGEAGSGTQIDLTTSPPIPAPKNRKTAADAAPSQEWAGGARHGQEPGVGTQAWAGGAPAVGSSSARHHPGELEVDWEGDCWTDWDEKNDDYKRIDCNACRRDIPEGFRWSCCAKLGNVEGCTSGEGQTIDEMYETSEGPSEYEYDSDEEPHDGMLEVDKDKWPGHDEVCDGPIDTKTNRRAYPQRFKWWCCGQNGESHSCTSFVGCG